MKMKLINFILGKVHNIFLKLAICFLKEELKIKGDLFNRTKKTDTWNVIEEDKIKGEDGLKAITMTVFSYESLTPDDIIIIIKNADIQKIYEESKKKEDDLNE